MKSSDFLVRRFKSPTLERAFRRDYARRYAGHRRLGGASLVLLVAAYGCRDWWLLSPLDPGITASIIRVRLAGVAGMALPLWFLWGPRAHDERWAVALLSALTLACWSTLITLMEIYPADLAFQEVFNVFLLVLFMIFTSFRLHAITAIWLVGLCAFSFRLSIDLWPRGNVATQGFQWLSRGGMVCYSYAIGVVVSIQFERAARRAFMFRRTLRAAKARIEAGSIAVNRQNQRMREIIREKERFFSSAYHDIQQPLAAINLFIDSARTKLDNQHAASHDLDVVEETARDLLDMFKHIQDYSELGLCSLNLAPVETQDMLTEVFEQYCESARMKGIGLKISGRGRQPPPIESDRSLFKRALSNFISNAIKNTVSGGVVIGWVELGERLRIDVWDTGAGISSRHREAIFAEYYQISNPGRDRAKGLGLGLSIVQRIVEILPMHSMRFGSVEGRGSRFSLYAPLAKLAPAIDTGGPTDDACIGLLKDKYVVLCDDEPNVLEGLRRLFVSAGALVDSAGSATGIEAILTGDGRAPDAIVMDIRLRDGSTGIEVAERIRRHFAWAGVLPVAFITGELVSPRALCDFAEPFLLLRKSATPKSTLAEVSRLVAAQRPA